MLPINNMRRDPKVIFVLGRPGSGKTLTTRLLSEHIQSSGIDKSKIALYNDYSLLQAWFHSDQDQRVFAPGPRGGFKVKNFKILDDSLREINKRALHETEGKLVIIIEFSRQNYISAFSNFDNILLESCTIIYLYTTLGTCLKRNEKRTPETDDRSGYVPPDILRTYYREDDFKLLEKKYSSYVIRVDNSRNGLSLLRENLLVKVPRAVYLNEGIV